MSIQDKFNKANVIYKITKDIDLGGETLTIPEGCTLDFQGGSFSNGTIVGNNSEILANGNIFDNITINGLFNNLDIEWFSIYDNISFEYCINNSRSVIIDLKYKEFIFSKMASIKRDNIVVKNAKIKLGSYMFRAFEITGNYVTFDNIDFDGCNNCTRGITFADSNHSSFVNSKINNVGNDTTEVTIGLELKAPCDFFIMDNVSIDNVNSLTNSSGVSVSFSVKDNIEYYPVFCQFKNSSITNITSFGGDDEDGIKILQIRNGGDFSKDATIGHHIFENLYFKNCTKRALKLQCSDAICNNITVEGLTGSQTIVDFFGDNIYLNGLYLQNIEFLNDVSSAIFTHDYKIAVLKNIFCSNSKTTFGHRNTLIYDTSSVENGSLVISNINCDFNILLRQTISADNKTVNIENVKHIAAYHYFILGLSYAKIYLKNINIDRSLLTNYWFQTFETIPTKELISDMIINPNGININVRGESDYFYSIYTSSKNTHFIYVKNGVKKVSVADWAGLPHTFTYTNFEKNDIVESPLATITCIEPISENYPKGFWKVDLKGNFKKTEINDFYNTNVYSLIGTSILDTTLNKPIWWTGAAWVDANGTEV